MIWPARLPARLVVGYGTAVVLSWLFLRNAEWRVLLDGLQSVGWPLLGAAILARLASLVVSSVRWQILLAPVRAVPLRPVLTAMMMGMAISALISMQAAEVVRPYLLSEQAGIAFTATVATVAVEWFLDLLSVLVLFLPVRGLVIRNAPAGRLDVNVVLGSMVIVSAVGLAALRWIPRAVGRIHEWIQDSGIGSPRARERVMQQLTQFTIGLRIMEQPAGVATVAVCSLLTALLTAVSAWLALRAFGLPVPFLAGFAILGLVTIGGMTPTPGAIGGFHAICQAGLVLLLHSDPARTVAPVIGLHAVLYLPAAAIGAVCFLRVRTGQQGSMDAERTA